MPVFIGVSRVAVSGGRWQQNGKNGQKPIKIDQKQTIFYVKYGTF